MEKFIYVFILVLILLALPYFYQIYKLKTISINDIPDSGSWVKVSRGNIYIEWFIPDADKEIKGTMVLVHGFSTPSFVWKGLLKQFTSAGFRVLVYDHFGRGFSERPGTLAAKKLEDNVDEKTILNKIQELNKDDTVSGILVQLPLPKHIDKQKVIETITPDKDVDGFHPMNVGNLSSGYDSSVPCTPLGCYLLIKKIEPNLSGKKAVVVGRSNLNGKPMTQLLLKENCTVTITHSKTSDLKGECLKGDIIVAAVGIPELVKGDWVKKDAIVIDVGINKTEKGIVGDVAFNEVSKVAKALTPVPGGVGLMTVACLMNNTLIATKAQHSL